MNDGKQGGVSKSRKQWIKASLLFVVFLFSLVASFFHFDLRFLSGFEKWELAQEVRDCPLPLSGGSNRLVGIWVSRMNATIESGHGPREGSVSSEGPVVVVCKSGGWRVNHGVILKYDASGVTLDFQ